MLVLAIGILLGRCFTPLPEDPAAKAAEQANAAETAAPEIWTCSMHPSVQSPKQNGCPICGMDLILLEDDGVGGDNPRSLRLDDDQKALAGIRTVIASRGEMAHEVRLVGKMAVDETALATLSAWVGGRLDKLFVESVGEEVNAGDPLAEIYSPELFHAQEELIVAARVGGPLEAAARKKLELFGLDEEQINDVIANGKPNENVTVTAPIGGTVLHRNAVEGKYVKEGEALFKVADLDQLWLELDAFEADLPWVRLGQSVEFEVDAWPGETFHGKVAFLDPVLNLTTRTVGVRVLVDNKDGRLRPEMFVRARVMAHVGAEELPLLIPSSAPLLTGDRAIVFVQLEDTELHGASVFEARDVILGPRAGDYFIVLAGLHEGDHIVERGAFTIDSELQLRGKPSMMSPDSGAEDDTNHEAIAPSTAEATEQITASAHFRVANGKLLLEAAALGEALASDDFTASLLSATRLREILAPMKGVAAPDAAMVSLVSLRGTMAKAVATEDIEVLRVLFYDLQAPLVDLATRFGYLEVERELAIFNCPMALEDGGDWIDFKGDGVRNPYYGAGMLKCGTEVRPLPNPASEK
ncbi:MAG: efflux RND transporter periplasmic adaptor subunit [Planctomycetes bacterium]|nr:efflux RND transporter periplasmic adaptor subunit [Planctomycetota bacterium]MCP4770189.1 efflux RND transporter periplasmic adaptor subunit [Planctomycetota bacterium]MCP4860663.1 efflux RND transporter periplasmic adaptor subunit [Planctomycetota bacterium]